MGKIIIIQGDYEYDVAYKLQEQLSYADIETVVIRGEQLVEGNEYLRPEVDYIVQGFFTDVAPNDWKGKAGEAIADTVRHNQIHADNLLIIHTQPVEEVDFAYENILKQVVPKKQWFRLDAVKLNEQEILEKAYIILEGWIKNSE